MTRIKLADPVADIYCAVAELHKLYDGRKFTPDGALKIHIPSSFSLTSR